MSCYRFRWLFPLVIFALAPECYAQTVVAGATKNCSGFAGMYKHDSFGHWEAHTGCLTLAEGSVHFDSGESEKKSNFDFAIGQLVSLKRSKFHIYGLHYDGLEFKLKNGKKFGFYLDVPSSPDQTVDAVEKAVRDMAAKNGVVLQ
jgi:hypothetical protein